MLHAYRSQRVEHLVDALSLALGATWPADPFEAVPLVVGSRGMERWLRHELATRLGGVAALEFLFPRAAFERAADELLAPSATSAAASARRGSEWRGARLLSRVLLELRAHLDAPAFTRAKGFLGELGDDVGARELCFAREVTATLERLLDDRAEDALAFSRGVTPSEPEHAWLAELVHALHADPTRTEPSPAERLEALRALGPGARAERRTKHLFVFGLSTLGPGDKAWLATLARHVELHLFVLAPSSAWWADLRSRGELRRALRRAATPGEGAEALRELATQNALLTANGAPSRDLQTWLEELGYDEPLDLPPLAPAPTLLGRVQEWVEQAADNPGAPSGASRRAPEETRDGDSLAPWRALAGCPSIELHACSGALRQCEALVDELLRRFAADPTLEPRQVLVMTPDAAAYAPLLAAVAARRHGDAPPVPLHVADLGLRATNPLAEALLGLLALAEERVTTSRLLEFLGNRTVRARFGLSEEDLADLRTMLVESGVRWGWDAADRARHGQPALDQNTVRFGLERLAIGVLMATPEGLEVVTADGASADALGGAEAPDTGLLEDGRAAGALPLELSTRDRVARFGKLADFLERLRDVSGPLDEPASPSEWNERLRTLLDGFTRVEDASAWLRAELDATLGELLPPDPTDGAALRLKRDAVAALLRGAFELPQRGERPVTGAVTVSALEPMRSVPFRVIALLGLDDGAFPRAARPPAWDPFARPRAGEHDRRAIDRHLFLEALLSARDALLIFGNGVEPQRGAAVPLSLVATELSELLAAGLGVAAPKDLIRHHPLQPWSRKGFDDERRLPFDARWRDAAGALAGAQSPAQAGLAATPLDARWPDDARATTSLTVDELATALAKPQRELLKQRLGLELENRDAEVLEREPLGEDMLDAWKLRDLVLSDLAAGAFPASDTADGGDLTAATEPRERYRGALARRLRAEGTLPLSAAGEAVLDRALCEAGTVWAKVRPPREAALAPLQAAVTAGGVCITAVAPDVRGTTDERHLVWLTASKTPNPTLQLRAWLTLLVAVAAGEKVASARLFSIKTQESFTPPATPEAALGELERLIAMWKRVRQSTVPLFPHFSRSVAEKHTKFPEATAEELVAAAEGWEDDFARSPTDSADVWVFPLFGHLDQSDLAADYAEPILAAARSVWSPLLAARSNLKEGKDPPAPSGGPPSVGDGGGERPAKASAKAPAKSAKTPKSPKSPKPAKLDKELP